MKYIEDKMRHFFIVGLLLFLISCSPIKPQLDGECIDATHFKVVQRILDNWAIAYPCRKRCVSAPMLLPPQPQVFYYHGMLFPNPTDKCASVVGSFGYETQEDTYRRIPIIKWKDK